MHHHSSIAGLAPCLIALLISSCGKESATSQAQETAAKEAAAPVTLQVKELGQPEKAMTIKAPPPMPPVAPAPAPQAAEPEKVVHAIPVKVDPRLRQTPEMRNLVRAQQMQLMQKSFRLPANGSNLNIKPPQSPSVK